jgi:alkyl sulfatase BDS1-like metallo-beta-lactamase superfamily hydrolase
VVAGNEVVVIDTLLTPRAGQKMLDRIHEQGCRVNTIIYTHGHGDHVGGARAFMGDDPEIIAQQYLLERLEKYRMLEEHRSRLTNVQFHLDMKRRKADYVAPTRTFADTMTFSLKDKTFELHHARGETDDHCWVWLPQVRTAFVGDLLIGSFPNIGNPFKPTRFALSWARALEAIREKQPEMIIAGGGKAVYQGDLVERVLEDTIAGIHSIHDQVVDLINEGVPVDEMIHRVKLPEHLESSPYLRFIYSRPEFAVYNIHRWYHGYFDFNPAHLLPRPQREVSKEIMKLIGSQEAVLDRSRQLKDEGHVQLALQLLDLVLREDPSTRPARQLRKEILERLVAEDYCTMSRNTFIYYLEQDKAFLGEQA